MTSLDSSKKFNIIIDTSHKVCIWLVQKDTIVDDSITEEQPSKALLIKMHEVLSRNKISLEEIDCFYFCKGPGSYTGLRISQGLEDYLKFNNLNCYDYYSFEILKVIESGYIFISNAFKNEFFVSEFKNDEIHYQKIKKEDLNSYKENKRLLSYDVKLGDIDYLDVFKNEFNQFFKEVLNRKNQREVFYYRTLSEEYTKA